jgi:hypothetical protein
MQLYSKFREVMREINTIANTVIACRLSFGFWSREALEPRRNENRLLAEGAISNILEKSK